MNIYLDHNATTPLRDEVINEIIPFLKNDFGNPSSLHGVGKKVREKIEDSREKVAKAISADIDEVYFTSGGTEADNFALFGTAFSNYSKNRYKILISSIEHHAVLESAERLEELGFVIEKIPVNNQGFIDLNALESLIDENTILVSVMLANNEIGTIQPVKDIVNISKKHGVIVHTDGVQALGKIHVNVNELGVDIATFSSHKIYGPKGIGAIFIRKGLKLKNIIYGGHQEKGVRPGTENSIGIIGFGKAVECCIYDVDGETNRNINYLRNKLENEIIKKIPYVKINGAEPRVPNTTNISFAFVEGETLITLLDNYGIAVSTGSACSSKNLDPSHVLISMGLSHELAHGSIRFSLGKDNTEEEIDYTVDVLKKVIERIRSMSPLFEDFQKSGLDFEEYIKRSQ